MKQKPPLAPDEKQLDMFSQPPILDAQLARDGRDEGVALVDKHSEVWRHVARQRVVEMLEPGWEGLSEDLRLLLLESGIGEPHSPNCWGSLTLWCVRQGILEPTGEIQNTRDPKSHACYTKRYRRVVT